MNRLFYPAIFHYAEEGGFYVTFPDIPECMSQGDDINEAYEMAVDALGLAITSREECHEPIPKASDPSELKIDGDSFIMVIEFDLMAYKKRYSKKAVKKTLSIPEWLNDAATDAGINFSQVLQDALKAQLKIG